MADSIDFLELYEKIFRVLPRNNIQRLMEVCYEVVGVPILTVDVMYNLLGIAPNVKTGDYQWDYLLENKGYETDMIVRCMRMELCSPSITGVRLMWLTGVPAGIIPRFRASSK